MPAVRGAKVVEEAAEGNNDVQSNNNVRAHIYNNVYRLGGNSCLSGDFMGLWQFDHELQMGENIIFEDMLHYTTVKTNMFNGINHPSYLHIHEIQP